MGLTKHIVYYTLFGALTLSEQSWATFSEAIDYYDDDSYSFNFLSIMCDDIFQR